MSKKIFLLFLIVNFSYTSLFSKTVDVSDYLKSNVVEKKLDNGITLLMLNRGFSSTLAFEISFKVGSSDESYRTIGAAHLLEHMLFKGTDKIGTKDYNKEKVILKKIEVLGETLDYIKLKTPGNVLIPDLEEKLKFLQKEASKYTVSSPYDKVYTINGGVGFNASTSRDKTGYYIQLPSSKLELWAKLESERLRNPILREFYLERNNVIQERLMRTDSKGTGMLFEKYIAVAFDAHPYRHPIIGWKSIIPNLSIKDVRKFYRDNYIPSRMVITIVGKQDTGKTFEVINKYFSSINERIEPKPIPVKEPAQIGEKRVTVNFESNPYLIIGWHKPTYPNKDDYIFDLISEILSSGKSSFLYKSLVIDKKIVSSIDVWNGAPGVRYDNMFLIFAAPKGENTPEDVEKEIYKEIDNFIKTISQKDLQKALNKTESSFIFGLDNNKGIARLLSYYQTVFNSWEYANNYLSIVKNISVDDVKKVAKKYFKKKNRVVGILLDSRKEK